jgi:hypothetical protein
VMEVALSLMMPSWKAPLILAARTLACRPRANLRITSVCESNGIPSNRFKNLW